MLKKASVMALEMPARDQPVAALMGPRKTASENSTPMATQVISAPAATMDQFESSASAGRAEARMFIVLLRKECNGEPIGLLYSPFVFSAAPFFVPRRSSGGSCGAIARRP